MRFTNCVIYKLYVILLIPTAWYCCYRPSRISIIYMKFNILAKFLYIKKIYEMHPAGTFC